MSLREQNIKKFQKEAVNSCASEEVRDRLSRIFYAYDLLISEGRQSEANELAVMIHRCLSSEGPKRARMIEAVDWRFRDLLLRAKCSHCILCQWQVVKHK